MKGFGQPQAGGVCAPTVLEPQNVLSEHHYMGYNQWFASPHKKTPKKPGHASNWGAGIWAQLFFIPGPDCTGASKETAQTRNRNQYPVGN